MTILVGLIDADIERRERFFTNLDRQLPRFPWLQQNRVELNALSLLLCASPEAPFSTAQDGAGRSALLLGEVIEPGFAQGAGAILSSALHKPPAEAVSGLNGYYLAGMVEPDGGLALGTDILGLFPLYYWTQGDVFGFSTIANAFLAHPAFSARPNPRGIAGSLLTMHTIEGETVWEGVRRLSAGSVLQWRPGSGAGEIAAHGLRASDRYFGWSMPRCKKLCHDLFDQAVVKAMQPGKANVLFSGGLDSRLIAGFYGRHAAAGAVAAVTLGDADDYEMQCAKRAADAVGWASIQVPFRMEEYPEFASIQASLEGVNSSFMEFIWWHSLQRLRDLDGRLMSGLLGDTVMGGTQIDYGFDDALGTYTFDQFFARRINNYGFKPETVSRLLRKGGLGEDVAATMRGRFEAIDGLPFQQCWLYDLTHRQRLHVAPIAWRSSFASWPVLPYVDLDLMEAVAGMPAAAYGGRRIQADLLCTHFPKLASLPLDRSSADTTPLSPTLAYRLRRRLLARLPKLPQIVRTHNKERRQYVRAFDVNGKGWLAVRVEAERYRSGLADIFDRDELAKLLPKPPQPLPCKDPINDSARYKTLLGLMLVLGKLL